MQPCRAMLEAALRAADLGHTIVLMKDESMMLEVLRLKRAYPHMYRLDEPGPSWLPVSVVCQECVFSGWITTTHTTHVCADLLTGASPAAYATVRCPECSSLQAVPLLGLPFWRWRWYLEAKQAHEIWRGLGATPAQWWEPSQWGEPIPSLPPVPPPPVPAFTQEAAMPIPLSPPVTYYLHRVGLAPLGYLCETATDPDGWCAVSVDLPVEEGKRAAALQEILRLTGKDPATYTEYMNRSAVRVRASRGMSSGQWWPRAQLPEGEELAPEAPGQILDLHPAEEE